LREQGCLASKWQLVASIARQVASIVDYLHHSAKIFQLDLKPGNLAIAERDHSITLMDLGSAYQAISDHVARYGTPGYIAPEVFQGKPVTERCDLFSLGMLLYEIITGQNPLIQMQRTALDVAEYSDIQTSVSISSISSVVEVPPPPADLDLSILEDMSSHTPEHQAPTWSSSRDHFDGITAAIPVDATPLFPLPSDHDWVPQGHRQKRYKDLLDAMREWDLQQRLHELATPAILSDLVCALTSFDSAVRPSAHDTQISLLPMAQASDPDAVPSVFLSHSHKDKSRFVNGFYDALKRKGFRVWLDEESLRTGEPFWERIAHAIESCDFVIVVLSKDSICSSGVSEEIRTAQLDNLAHTKLLPIRIDPIKFESIPRVLRSRHVLDFVGWEEQSTFRRKLDKLTADIMALHSERARSKAEQRRAGDG
jgi:serine/threonine protein kinase